MAVVFCDTSVLIRYFAEDDIPRAAAAAALIDGETTLTVSTTVILETLHVLRRRFGFGDALLGDLLITFLTRDNVELADADKSGVLAAISTNQGSSRRIPDAVIAMAAAQAGVDYIATFDAKFRTPLVRVRML
jgi:predicted nucleic acid-binding protein